MTMKKMPLLITLLVLALVYSLAANATFYGKNLDLVNENASLKNENQKGIDFMLVVNAALAGLQNQNVKACGLYHQAIDKHVDIDDDTVRNLERTCAKSR